MLTLCTGNRLLSRGIDPALGGPGPHKLTEKLVQNENVAYRHPRNKTDTIHVNSQEKEVRYHATPQKTFPTQRRPSQLPVSSRLGALILSEKEVDRVKRLLYTYRELNAAEPSQTQPTDLYKPKVRLREGTKSYPSSSNVAGRLKKEFWLIKISKEAMACGMYERTLTANSKLSDWNADAVLVDKPGQRESCITFNYRNVWEDMPGCYLELISKVHDYLSNPSHQFYHQFDLKHGYWIQYIVGPRNKVADSLSRNIFHDSECRTTLEIERAGILDNTGTEPRWIWKDGHRGYEELLKSKEGRDAATAKDWRKVLLGKHDEELAQSNRVDSRFLKQPRVSYYCSQKSDPKGENTSPTIECPTTYKLPPERWRRCVTKDEVAFVLHKAHGESGHFASGITLRFLSEVYWPRKLKDVTDYIGGCLTCAKHDTALRSKTLSKFLVASPNEVWGNDFMGPFPKAEKSNHQYILLVDYFTRHVWTYPCIKNNSEETIRCLKSIFGKEGIPVGIYADEGPHFQKATRESCEEAGVVWILVPVAAKRSVGMVEKANDLLQIFLVKGGDSSTWPFRLAKSTLDLNRREVAHLGFSPFELHRGYLPETTLSSSFPS
ncbi:hypothetical protein K3495_g1139 [Podosphaera aphanis]|nr:hypothetical protein K3495_g1139 [Podosphaera aphanis]